MRDQCPKCGETVAQRSDDGREVEFRCGSRSWRGELAYQSDACKVRELKQQVRLQQVDNEILHQGVHDLELQNAALTKENDRLREVCRQAATAIRVATTLDMAFGEGVGAVHDMLVKASQRREVE